MVDAPPPPEGLHERVLERVGEDAVSGALPVGPVVSLEQLSARYAASRTVVREVVKVLESKRVLSSRARVGVTVLPASHWNVLDPMVVRWRLDGPQRGQQLLALSELRLGVEPVAAALAAARASPQQREALAEAVVGMSATARTPGLAAYLEHDAAFHRTLLEASGNEALAALSGTVREVLAGRIHHHLMPTTPEVAAIRWHADVAEAVAAGDAAGAERAMRLIVTESMTAMSVAFPDAGPATGTTATTA